LSGEEVQLVRRPEGEPRAEDFRLVSSDPGEPGSGQILVRNSWMSIDPSARLRMHAGQSSYLPSFELGEAVQGWAVGEVVSSRSERFAVGDQVLHQKGWRQYALLDTDQPPPVGPEKVETDAAIPAKTYLGALSWVGLTSYAGLLHVAELREGDVVFVSGAAGAVGSLVVQIAGLRGHTVIGSAGSAAKVAFVRDELGADAVVSYRDGAVGEQLAKLAPEGIDLYFDNVGGDHLEAALDALRPHGRVALCGAISTYNESRQPPGPSNLFQAVAKGLTLRGFLSRMYAERMAEFRQEMRGWLAAGRIVYPETVFSGLERAPEALIAQLRGENVGKVLVEVS
jgi:NADPH-dependent curcumin reductase CurA